MDLNQIATSDDSVYLSFTADDTLSNTAYKTMEAADDSSYLTTDDNLAELHSNTVKTVLSNQENIPPNMSPLRPFHEKLLKKFDAISSTPSNEQMLKRNELKLSRKANNDVKSVNENKFIMSDVLISDDSMSPSAQTPTMIDSETLLTSITIDEDFVEEIKPINTVKKITDTLLTEPVKEVQYEKTGVGLLNDNYLKHNNSCAAPLAQLSTMVTGSILADSVKDTEIINTVLPDSVKETEIINTVKSLKGFSLSQKSTPIAQEKKIANNLKECYPNEKECMQLEKQFDIKAVNEPNSNLQPEVDESNKTVSKRSLLPHLLQIPEETEVPQEENIVKMIDEMLQLTEEMGKNAKNESKKKIQNLSNIYKNRYSVLPTTAGDKRSHTFKPRMSAVVKTTFNSPSRKTITRPLAGLVEQKRRSLMPPKTCASVDMRRSLLPKPKNVMGESLTGKSLASTVTSSVQAKPIPPPKESISAVKAKVNSNIEYVCNTCDIAFRIKSSLDAHKRSHEVGAQQAKKLCNNHLINVTNQCKYCDKKFALERTLHIHLMQNCIKIPPVEKKKLQFTELDHVEKSQLPSVFSHDNDNKKLETTPIQGKQKIDKCKMQMPPPLSTKIPKTPAHAGVYRTPTKSILCHVCKQSFMSVLDYTNHSLTMHSTNGQMTHNALNSDDK